MLHVLPAGTYGLRPAVNRSNTRTRRGTPVVVVCTAMQTVQPVHPLGAFAGTWTLPSPPVAATTSPSDYVHPVPR